jgi:hypothetical protein
MDKALFEKYGKSYLFALAVIYVAALIYGTLGSEHITELLNNNLHYAMKTFQDTKRVRLVCSIKNTGYRPLDDVKLILWTNEIGFFDIECKDENVKMISKETNHNYIFGEAKIEGSIFPEEIKTLHFYFTKKKDITTIDSDPSYKAISLRVYSANVPAIQAENISKSTGFEIGPYLYDLLWAMGWTYISIAIFVVLPLALILFIVLALVAKASNSVKKPNEKKSQSNY